MFANIVAKIISVPIFIVTWLFAFLFVPSLLWCCLYIFALLVGWDPPKPLF